MEQTSARTKGAMIVLRSQYLAFAALTLFAAAFAAILARSHGDLFRRYVLGLNPVLAVALVAAVGAASLAFLHLRGGFDVLRAGQTLRGVTVSAVLAAAFVVPTIVVDIIVGFPRDLNAPLPEALLFYPAIGYIAEVVFHALPLALALLALSPLYRPGDPGRLGWVAIAVAALVEPAFQVIVGLSPETPVAARRFVAPHLFAFALAQLVVFRRYDFVSMYAFRLIYYLLWHIVWGYVRLGVLF